MKLSSISFLFVFVLLCTGGARRRHRCKPKYHYWKPYVATGTNPKDAFPIEVPENYARNYIARVTVPYKKWSRVVPAQLMCDHVESPSIYGVKGTIERYVHGVEILHVTDTSGYHWMPVYSERCATDYNSSQCYQHTRHICYLITSCCCLVEGGIAWETGKGYQLYHIGRVIEGGKVRIGRALLRENKKFGDDIGIFYLSGWKTVNRKSNFDVLAYDCDRKIPNCTSLMGNVFDTSSAMRERWKTPFL